MGFPDRQKLAALLEANGGAVPPGADPVAAGAVAPPEAAPVPPREGPEAEGVPPEAGAMVPPEAGAAIPPEAGAAAGGAPMGAGQLMPENLTPEQQEQMQAELALAARRKMAGV